MYDFLVVGAGLFGVTFARLATDAGYSCLVLDKRSHIAGNCFTRKEGLIDVHEYGPHIFHTSNPVVWNYVNKYATFNSFILQPKAIYKNKLYSLPFNMQTFYDLWGVLSPEQAKAKIASQRFTGKVTNLEEQAKALVGDDVYNVLIKGYTEKQWGRAAKDLPAFIIKRLPLRFEFDCNYFNDTFQGVPVDGYTAMFKNMLRGIPVRLGVDYLNERSAWDNKADHVVFTGCLDEFFDYEFGKLQYRSLRFEHTKLDVSNYQGNAVINYTDKEVPYTRCTEHKHFTKVKTDYTWITREFSHAHVSGDIPYYPINSDDNQAIYKKYADKASAKTKFIFGGRLANYKYMDMHVVIEQAHNVWNSFVKQNVVQ